MSGQQTVAGKLKQLAKERAESPAFIFRSPNQGRYELSWAQLYKLAGAFASDLKKRGVGRGQLVVNTLVNSPERAVCEAGIWLSAAASANAHCQMADGSDLLHTIRVSRASAVLLDPDINNSPWNALKNHVAVEEGGQVTSSALPDLKTVFFIRRVAGGAPEDFLTRLETGNQWFEADDITAEDILTVFTTSGTTGFSKLVIYTNREFISFIEPPPSAEEPDLSYTNMTMFKTAPMGWLGGCVGAGVVQYHTSVFCDARACEIPKEMSKMILEALEEENCDVGIIASMYLPQLAQLVKARHGNSDSAGNTQERKVQKLKAIALGGLPVTKKMVECALILADTATVSYGGTDFSLVSMFIVTDSESYVDYDTGVPLKGMSVKIVHQDDESKVLPANQVGNILIKGPRENLRFLGESAATTADKVTKDGYFRTQDIGRLDERGHLIVEGRGCDAIMRGAYIFYPSWMEARIHAHPGVYDVIIVGIPDPFLHEELCACIVLDSDSASLDDVRHFVEKDVLTSEEDLLSPRPRHYLDFESFPRTDSGKPNRKLIKAQAAQRLQGGV